MSRNFDPPRLADLRARYARAGRVERIFVRPERRAAVLERAACFAGETGLEGDRQARAGKRAVTLLQAEHLPVIAACLGAAAVDPRLLRRNLLISGINLNALREGPVLIGAALLRLTVPCHPCSRMEEALGPGGYNAMRGHGGWCAEVLRPGRIAVGDSVRPEG